MEIELQVNEEEIIRKINFILGQDQAQELHGDALIKNTLKIITQDWVQFGSIILPKSDSSNYIIIKFINLSYYLFK